MGYVAVRGGAEAIEASIDLLRFERIRSGVVLDVVQVRAGMRRLVEQVMAEGSLYDEEAAAVAVAQAEGSPEEAVFLLRAYRSTLPRAHVSLVTRSESMRIQRRISAAFKDIPGGQILGASPDYTHRLIDPRLFEESSEQARSWIDAYRARAAAGGRVGELPKVVDFLRAEGLLAPRVDSDEPPRDVTREMLLFPAARSERLQTLARGQTGAVTAFAYAALRGYGALHPTVAELRVGYLSVYVPDPFGNGAEEDSFYVGEVLVTEVEMLVPVSIPRGQGRSEIIFELGYGLCFGRNDTKAVAMSILDHSLQAGDRRYATGDEEFILMHVDPVEATGFISHLKLPHYVTFQSKLDAVRAARRGAAE